MQENQPKPEDTSKLPEKTLDELIAEEEQKERDEFDERKNWFSQR